jgi:CheY-like chemotaxis protein
MMSGTEKSDVLESLISLLEENEKRVDALAKKMEDNGDVLRSLHSLLEENEKRVDTLETKLKIIEQKDSANSSEIVYENKSTPEITSEARTILVVDDDEKLTTSFKLILENAGYVVEVANTGFNAHILVTKNFYDLVILDWHLHDIFGDQIAETIEERHSETKIIFITGYSYILDEYERENEILLKPIDPDYLLETVAKVFPNEQNLRASAQNQRYRKDQGIEQGPTAMFEQHISDN